MRERVPLLDLASEVEFLWEPLQGAIQEVLRSGQFILGPEVDALEREVAAYLGVRHAVALNSGTDALVIALRALGVGPGDEVITTPFTFFATAEAISHVGASPVFVDIEPDTFALDPDLAEAAVTPRTRAIIPVHLFGHAADMDRLGDLARAHDLHVVEDVAQAFGGRFHGRMLGTLGDFGAFSFFPSKNLGAYGDGGLLATDDAALAEAARMLRAHGSRRKYYNEVVGYNSRLDALQAAILRVKLPHLDEWNRRRCEAAAYYREILADLPGVVLPAVRPGVDHVYHQYTIRIPNGRRDAVQQALAGRGIGTMVYYPVPLHQLPVYRHMNLSLPAAEAAAREVLSLPMGPFLRREQQDEVAAALRQALW
ncbi:dTDP-4-amino-4,6-dideoxygalactose transaminase [Symbiobacterium terraclitae]|uniref:dTDP-4-amino-4,6-dideoxygalactose transaminase n=1 Tax=Symbiobacterium terraclitae TaxID=557451 RepID=A0ABS4JWD9_9FIRM|nr:DegT/DnrJ/EryC1/StrS family aminotransferase [Symbiobacterium terraclitae]MBP2019852.1 dTDP-4-amino-4,6-dideoxygalactose transaminase [Symbiobacterium terraclitae]